MAKERSYVICELCNQSIRESGINAHQLKIHGISNGKNAENSKKLKKKASNNRKSLASVNKIKINNLEIMRNELEQNNAKPIYILWEDVLFEKDKIRFSSLRIKDFLNSIDFKGVFPEINSIKKEYFQRLYANETYKLFFYEGRLIKEISPQWQRLVQKIEVGLKYFEFKFSKTNSFGPELSVSDTQALFNINLEKSYYLQYLATIQDEKYNLIPIKETTNTSTENSFIFRLKTKNNNVLLIWENVNPQRACHVFSSSIEHHQERLMTIESFICGSTINKRSTLHFLNNINPQLKEKLGYLGHIRHEGIYDFRIQIDNLIKKH
jgi:hypothetical protein